MLTELKAFLDNTPDANSFTICSHFQISRGMCERLLCQLEDMGFLTLETSNGCASGGCSSGGCSTGGCSSSGPAATLNALAESARNRRSSQGADCLT